MDASCALGNPLCCLAYGKMANISRSRSRSVSTAPLTRATGLSLTCNGDTGEAVADGIPTMVGVWEATWAAAAAATSRIQIESSYLINSSLVTSEKRGEINLSPWVQTALTGIVS